ncbi:alpha-ketoglutarate-dependent dioxygenase AlkB family protein [Shewanella cyperi]|uniref:alpha-ketoglutarate-dependent dioxygenase AlkB family protein n=1 Tax=Shewanella cyperi TaxID=2814292 RepID=UPI001A94249E|nr:alpha-ketoglutarate-dependent dioxygenase AlkB [Shewanella cyperi]QSX39894.1 alpha-ketoglutarate-dependent dioxygenase AlkB [Shewanella cyperi]
MSKGVQLDFGLGDAEMPPMTYIPGFLDQTRQDALWAEAGTYPFESPSIRVYGKWHPIPRQQVWFADPGCDYVYSSLLVKALPWPPLAARLRAKLEWELGFVSNGVLVNRYRSGEDAMGFHSDDEPELVPGSDIASITLGASREFVLKDKLTGRRLSLVLNSGDLLLMHHPMQQHWQHGLPRCKGVGERLNFTFRLLTPGFHGTAIHGTASGSAERPAKLTG